MGPVVRLVGKGIGLASEALKARKESKARDKSPGPTTNNGRAPSPAPGSTSGDGADADVPPYAPPAYDTLDPSSAGYGLVETRDDEHAAELIEKGHAVPYDPNSRDLDPNEAAHFEDDEAMWELDEAAAMQEPSSTVLDEPKDDQEKPDVRKLIQKFLTAHPPPSSGPPTNPLPCPVIIPQRRPHSKSRGFVQAYAPVLENCGIDQATFMDFLSTFHKASQASPVFEVIFVAGHLMGYVPSVAAMAVSMSVQAAAGAAIVTHSRYRTNDFLTAINNHFLHPRGLHALLISYKSSDRSSFSSAPTDISHSIAKSIEPEGMGSKMKQNFKYSGGKTYGQNELPEFAPLIFPNLDAAADVDGEGEEAKKKQNAFKKSSKFISEYMDRRAQVEFAHDDPNSSLAVPQDKEFASRFSDPNHPVNSGSLISLVTGGKVDPKGYRRAHPKGPIGRVRVATKTNKPIRKLLSPNVLYLMITNMPSEEEIAQARREMEQEKADKKAKKGKGDNGNTHKDDDEMEM
ncbi:hypothetical protein P7C71_g6538, partial [Lecanoromycetidae sp. Uapishka_2]